MKQFEQTSGIVEAVASSSELAENLKTRRKILISTQQKFPYVLEKLEHVKGKYFAIIVDEAHSSQTGEGAKKVKEVLTTNVEKANETEPETEESTSELIDRIEKEMKKRGPQPNLSYYAFTATPNKKTLKLFGTKLSDEDYVPIHTYSMRQAIEEGFILDVLKNYTTYERYFRIAQTASEDRVVEGRKASRELMKYVDTHHLNLSNKTRIIVEHFRTHCRPKIGGLAKAMVISSSRLQAVKYKQEIDEYITTQNYEDIKTLVAFSGTVQDESGNHTEQSINKTSTDWELRAKFDTVEYNILIVADKYQTGYDQPLLHTMYVDKKLFGTRAVQTLSRINRTHPGKTETFVIDFQNSVDEIVNAYSTYYDGTTLVDKIDPKLLFKLFDDIMNHKIIFVNDLDSFAEIFFKSESLQTTSDHGRLYALMNPIIERFNDTKIGKQDEFKHSILKYIEGYSFLTQIVPYEDTKLEKLFVVCKFIVNQDIFKGLSTQIPELKGDISLQWYRLERMYEGNIRVHGRHGPLIAKDILGKPKSPQVLTTLSNIVKLFNERFGDLEITEEIRLLVARWLRNLQDKAELKQIAKENAFSDFYRLYESKLQDQMLSSLHDNPNIIRKIFSEPDLKQKIMITAAEAYHTWAKTNDIPPISPNTQAENRLRFRETIRSCKRFIYWIDMYIGKDGLEFLIDSFNHQEIKEIKILTSLYKNESQIDDRLRDTFIRFREELSKKGISLEMRLVTTKVGYDKVPHDRFIIAENIKYNVPPFTTIVKGKLSEIKITTNIIPFEGYWNDKDSFDIVMDWMKIKSILGFQAVCSNCHRYFYLSYNPYGVNPVHCNQCRRKLR